MLTRQLLQLGSDMLIAELPTILDGSLIPQSQDESKATYTTILTKQDSVLQWDHSAVALERQIRAFASWPQSRAQIKLPNGKALELVITEATTNPAVLTPGLAHVKDGQLLIGTAQDSLEVLRLKVPGKKEISAAEFCRGYRL